MSDYDYDHISEACSKTYKEILKFFQQDLQDNDYDILEKLWTDISSLESDFSFGKISVKQADELHAEIFANHKFSSLSDNYKIYIDIWKDSIKQGINEQRYHTLPDERSYP